MENLKDVKISDLYMELDRLNQEVMLRMGRIAVLHAELDRRHYEALYKGNYRGNAK